MAIYYIDVDDEITSAAARIRDSSDTRIALVIQGGSRVATSRINFRLLAREARHHGKRLAIVATDPSARSLAQAAGLPLYASVAEYQKAESARPPGTQPGGADGVGDAPDELAATVDSGSGGRAARLTGAAGSRRAIGPGQPAARSGRRLGVGASRWLALGLVAALAVGAIGAFLLLPNATVVLTLREVPVGPLNLTIKVDPGITATNDSTLMVPGISKEFTAQVIGTFDATGQNVAETAATGTVTFTSWNTASVVQIPAGTQVETAAKVAFATTSAVTVPKAVVPGGFTPGTADVGVAAVRKGLSGNVAAGAIVNVPAWLATALVVPDQVTNKKATSGGTHTVTPFVQQSDIDAAEVSLAKQLDSSVMVRMNEPASVAAGLELFPKTAHMGDASFDPDPATLLSQQLTSFDLAATGTATATATNLATVRSLAERKVRAKVQAGHALVEGSVVVALGSPTATGSAVSVPVVASGLQAATVDVDQLRAAIKGKSVAEAKAYLSTYGDAEVSISPFWVSTISGFDFRIDVRVIAPTARPTATAILGATARVTLAPGRTATPTEGATPGPSASAEPSPTATPEATASSEASPTATP
ncbi:MAG: baseplate J/gp47 family protein [Candidatus Limnocylindrales bacterium]|jgi:hypothetical protein